MNNPNIKSTELSMKPTGQTDEEKIQALMRLGLSRRRCLLIVKMRDHDAKGDTVDVSIEEHQKDKVA